MTPYEIRDAQQIIDNLDLDRYPQLIFQSLYPYEESPAQTEYPPVMTNLTPTRNKLDAKYGAYPVQYDDATLLEEIPHVNVVQYKITGEAEQTNQVSYGSFYDSYGNKVAYYNPVGFDKVETTIYGYDTNSNTIPDPNNSALTKTIEKESDRISHTVISKGKAKVPIINQRWTAIVVDQNPSDNYSYYNPTVSVPTLPKTTNTLYKRSLSVVIVTHSYGSDFTCFRVVKTDGTYEEGAFGDWIAWDIHNNLYIIRQKYQQYYSFDYTTGDAPIPIPQFSI